MSPIGNSVNKRYSQVTTSGSGAYLSAAIGSGVLDAGDDEWDQIIHVRDNQIRRAEAKLPEGF